MSPLQLRQECAAQGCTQPAVNLPVIAFWAGPQKAGPPCLTGIPKASLCVSCRRRATLDMFLEESLLARIAQGLRRAGKAPPDWTTAELRWSTLGDPLYDVDRGGERIPGGRRFAV